MKEEHRLAANNMAKKEQRYVRHILRKRLPCTMAAVRRVGWVAVCRAVTAASAAPVNTSWTSR